MNQFNGNTSLEIDRSLSETNSAASNGESQCTNEHANLRKDNPDIIGVHTTQSEERHEIGSLNNTLSSEHSSNSDSELDNTIIDTSVPPSSPRIHYVY